MRSFIQFSLLCSCLSFGTNLIAKPISTTPGRQKAQCDAGVSLCDAVARDDLNRCNANGQSHCSENYYEDINICTSDYHDCLDEIAHQGGGKGTIFLPPKGSMAQLSGVK